MIFFTRKNDFCHLYEKCAPLFMGKSKIYNRILSILSILMLPVMGQAHPGHGASNGHDAIHYLASGHAGPAILLLTALCIYFILREPKTQSQRTKH